MGSTKARPTDPPTPRRHAPIRRSELDSAYRTSPAGRRQPRPIGTSRSWSFPPWVSVPSTTSEPVASSQPSRPRFPSPTRSARGCATDLAGLTTFNGTAHGACENDARNGPLRFLARIVSAISSGRASADCRVLARFLAPISDVWCARSVCRGQEQIGGYGPGFRNHERRSLRCHRR
jgi:hypothetical protein